MATFSHESEPGAPSVTGPSPSHCIWVYETPRRASLEKEQKKMDACTGQRDTPFFFFSTNKPTVCLFVQYKSEAGTECM